MRLGPYEIVRELGRGGMGVVYEARHPELPRALALKTLTADAAKEPDLFARFRREAEALAKLRHPNIVPVHQAGSAEGVPYIVMDLIEGSSLDQRLAREGRLEPKEAARIGHALAHALEHAHGAGVLHRDVKPANVLLTPEGRPLLTDFGLARDLKPERERLTQTGQVVGTPAYMPPEQVAGDPRLIGPTADVYGLGATLYHLACGVAPFRGGTMNVLNAVLSRAPAAPRAHVPGIDHDLETIVLTCLEKEVSERYPSAAALADDLERYLRDEPIMARRGGAPRIARSLRQRPALLLGMVGATLVGGLLTLALWPKPASVPKPAKVRPRRVPEPPERPPEPARPRPAVEAGSREPEEPPPPPSDEFLTGNLTKRAARGEWKALEYLVTFLPETPGLEGWLTVAAKKKDPRAMLGLADLYRKRGELDHAATWYNRCLSKGPNPRAWYGLGLVFQKPHGQRVARPLVALAFLQKAAGADLGVAHLELGQIYSFRHENLKGVDGDPARAQTHYASAAKLGEPWGHLNYGIYLNQGWGGPADPVLAAEHFEKAGNAGVFVGWLKLGRLHREGRGVTRDLERANALFEKALRGAGGKYGAEALFALGELLHSGELDASRKEEGWELIKKAAKEGSEEAKSYVPSAPLRSR